VGEANRRRERWLTSRGALRYSEVRVGDAYKKGNWGVLDNDHSDTPRGKTDRAGAVRTGDRDHSSDLYGPKDSGRGSRATSRNAKA